MDINKFKKMPLMGIVRGISTKAIGSLMEVVIESGLYAVEITMNTSDASGIIEAAVKASAGRVPVGAGTVLSLEDMNAAVDAGASFIVMPSFVQEVVASCTKNNIPVFPGALTPTEVSRAWDAGASMVKVFPSSAFGPSYFKALKGPFNDIELMAVGGVNSGNIEEYFSSGASAVAFGASVFKPEWLESGDFVSIGNLVRQYVEAVKKAINN